MTRGFNRANGPFTVSERCRRGAKALYDPGIA